MKIRILPKWRPQGKPAPKRLNVLKLKRPSISAELADTMEERAQHIQVTDDVEDSWTSFSDTMWCTKNMLSCNPSKTKILQLLSRLSQTDSPPTLLLVGRGMIVPVLVAQDLGITLDKHLTLHQHINNVSKSGSYAMRNIGQIRKYLNNKDCEKLVHAFVTSRLDCCNSILYGLPDSELAKLQQIQNTAARLVVRLKKCDHITPVLQKLHWLPVKSQINYKILLLTYKALNGLAPSYLSELLDIYCPSRNLRSSSKLLLTTKKTNTVNYGDRAFSICAPKLWNNLPLHIRRAKSLSSFKSQLKTHLFNNSWLDHF